jgi:hypothetical protein
MSVSTVSRAAAEQGIVAGGGCAPSTVWTLIATAWRRPSFLDHADVVAKAGKVPLLVAIAVRPEEAGGDPRA